mmetsp:Transcript_58762/g.108451  ORF Transcript_58762/g.108451 Transcript_58762/m.108451 type:complete len:211 (+) Transcript_58762:143-775(+)
MNFFGGGGEKRIPIDGETGMLGRLWSGVQQQGQTSSDEERQGLLGNGLLNIAEQAGFGSAYHAATIPQETWTTFFVLFAFGVILTFASFSLLPMILLAPIKFASVFTAGNVCILSSFAVLKGPSAFMAHLLSKDRRSLTFWYVGSMVGALWSSCWYGSALLTILFSVIQMVAVFCFFVAYIPGGSYLLDAFQQCAGGVCHVCWRKVRVPL